MRERLVVLCTVAVTAAVAALLWITPGRTGARADADATIFFSDGFETGTLGGDWQIETTNEGRVVVTDTYPHAGTYHLLLDDYQDDTTDSLAAAILTVDLAGQTDVVLDFWGREVGGYPDDEDGVFVSDDGGASWEKILDLNALRSWYRHVVIDLDEAVASAGVTFNDHFLIKLQSYDDDPFDGFAIDELTVRSTPEVTPASFPYHDGFESGALDDAWRIAFTNEGRAVVTDTTPYAGTYYLLLDDTRDDTTDSLAAAILSVDLAGQTDVVLDFWGREVGGYPDGEDGVFVSDDGGASWEKVLDLNDLPSWYRHVVIDLDEAVAVAGLSFNDHFLIKFQSYDDDPFDGFAIDEVRVRSTPAVTPASFPYYDGFESGALGDAWRIAFTNEGRVVVTDTYPYAGAYHLLLDDTRDDTTDSLAAAILSVDLAGQTDVVLDFWGREVGGYPDDEDGIFVSDDGGASWEKIVDLNALRSWYRHVVIDLDEAVANAGLSFNDHFLIKFQSYDDDPFDGFAIDEVRVRSTPAVTPASFPYYDGFESGALGDAWRTAFTNEGRVVVTDTYPYAGTYHLLLDDTRDDTTDSLAAAILSVDLAGQTDVVLDFWGREVGGYPDDEDGVFVSDDGGANWEKIFDLNTLSSSYERIRIDLDQEIDGLGLAFNDHFLIKLQSYDDDPLDGFAIDALQVRSNAAPTLGWCGDTGYEADGLEPESGHQLTTYTYRVSYADPDGDPPAGVWVHVEKDGTEMAGSPFAMACASGDYEAGVTCTHNQSGLEAGHDYTYAFSAEDDQGNGSSTAELGGPDVYHVTLICLPAVLKNVGRPAGPPELYPIDNPDGSYAFTVSWSEVARATRYTLEEDTDPGFPNPDTVYSGSSTSTRVSAGGEGTYFFRVRASSSEGVSGWSNVESTEVTVSPPPCPRTGHWSGTTSWGNTIYFDVVDAPRCQVENLTIYYVICGRKVPTQFYDSYRITNDHFKAGDNRNYVEGDFTSDSDAEGDYEFYLMCPGNPPIPDISSGTWTAEYEP